MALGFPRKIELLAPARNRDVAIAAINCGADAVYIGATNFGARSAAGNSVEDIAAVVEYARRFDAKVYVAVNTVIYDDESKQVESLVRDLYNIGVDALIVQDMSLLRMDIPPIPLHASTQCDIRTVEKAKFLESVGFSQLVLARELSLGEISSISSSIDIPVEVFVHGALCVCYSGRCTLSCATKSRSANRGECAQLCRISYDLVDGSGKLLLPQKHLLSLRDMNQSENIAALIKAGASSFKIEGRLKDADYVCNVVAAYRRAIDDVIAASNGELERSSHGTSALSFSPSLGKSFNRGFTQYFLNNRRPQSLKMASFLTPKSMGECIGKVKSVRGNRVILDSKVQVHNGDGISYFNSEGRYDGFRANSVNGAEITALSQSPITLKPGDVVYRTFDKDFNDMVSMPSRRTLAIDFALRIVDGEVVLHACDERGIEADIPVGPVSRAEKDQADAQMRVLTKTGNTIFSPRNISTLKDCFIPSSLLTAARRSAIEAVEAAHKNVRNADVRRTENRDARYPSDSLVFSDNVANRLAERFYREHGVLNIEPAAELRSDFAPGTRLMTTRYCLRRELGCCIRDGRGEALVEPLTLRHNGMPALRLHFDCRNCEMHVILGE